MAPTAVPATNTEAAKCLILAPPTKRRRKLITNKINPLLTFGWIKINPVVTNIQMRAYFKPSLNTLMLSPFSSSKAAK